MAARGDITQHANPKFLWGTLQILSYKPIKFQPICSAGPFLAQSPILTGHPILELLIFTFSRAQRGKKIKKNKTLRFGAILGTYLHCKS